MPGRAIRSSVILAVGSELTTGSTSDTNSGELARELTTLGVRVLRASALPDDLEIVRAAFARALGEADLVVSTGGLGPTPDDLTREAIAAASGLEPRVDPDTERWLRALFARRTLAMPDANLKQAWLIDGAEALPNAHGTAPGWWVERPDGRLIVALPGPPREMWPMWRGRVIPRLEAGRLGRQRAVRTLRLTGIGESAIADLIGEEILRARIPEVATYARADAVDVVVSAASSDVEQPVVIVDAMTARLRALLSDHVFAEGDQTWPEALAGRLDGRTLAIVEMGTGGQLTALLGAAPFVVHAELVRGADSLGETAEQARRAHATDVGVAVEAYERGGDTRVRVAIATDHGVAEHQRTAFLGGEEGRRRAALAACATLWQSIADEGGS